MLVTFRSHNARLIISGKLQMKAFQDLIENAIKSNKGGRNGFATIAPERTEPLTGRYL